MNERLRVWAAVAGLCLLVAVGLVSFAADAQACPANEVEDIYFSDATFTTEVGYCVLHCNCWGRRCSGQITAFRQRFTSPCNE